MMAENLHGNIITVNDITKHAHHTDNSHDVVPLIFVDVFMILHGIYNGGFTDSLWLNLGARQPCGLECQTLGIIYKSEAD